jgi:acyl-CoA thioesterase I
MAGLRSIRHSSAVVGVLAAVWLSVCPPAANAATLLVVGDSLSAEYGLKRDSGWVALMSERLKAERPDITVINASISGDTSSGGRARLGALLRQHQPRWVLIELGANDALRGLPLAALRDNLNAMVKASQAQGATVLLIGIQVPPNYGPRYTRELTQSFADVSKQTGAALVPFLLSGVADAANPLALFQADRIHPNESAQAQLVDNVWPHLMRLL